MSSNSESEFDIECGICGEAHKYPNCDVVEVTDYIVDKEIPTRARLTLPEDVDLKLMADGSYDITANKFIRQGTRFGPLEAQKVLTLNPSIIFPLKIFNTDIEDLQEYYLDTSDENNCNWMMFITSAHTLEEQNLMCFQDGSKIYYVARKDIEKGDFLKVWYAPHYAKKMKTTVLTTEKVFEYNFNKVAEEIDVDVDELMEKQQNITKRNNWICKFCGKLIENISQFAVHIIDHYTRKISKYFYCDFCKRHFRHEQNYWKHMKVNHKNSAENLGKTNEEASSTQNKSGNEDFLVGGPLLNDLLTDSIDNSNLIMSNDDQIDIQNMLLETDNLLTENVKGLEHFNFEINELQEQYICDICLKPFSKLRNLLQHLWKHTGRFTCCYCLKIFCRKENLQGHSCSRDVEPKHVCDICQRSFLLKKFYIRHMNAIHNEKYSCENCQKKYYSQKDYESHVCLAAPDPPKPTFVCHICSKTFYKDEYLKKHVKRHGLVNKKASHPKPHICEICAQRFVTRKGLIMHKYIHAERRWTCKICNKKFYRQDMLTTHMICHQEAKFTCNVCNVKLKSKSILTIHMLQHTGVKPHQCDICSKTFFQPALLKKHYLKQHNNACVECHRQFHNKDLLTEHQREHTLKDFYECPICNKTFKLKSSVARHLKHIHPDVKIDTVKSAIKPKKVDLKKLNTMCEGNANNTENAVDPPKESTTQTDENENTLQDNSTMLENIANSFEDIVITYDTNNTNTLFGDSYENITNTNSQERLLDFGDLEMDLASDFSMQQNTTVENNEVSLSMPDLTDQEITFGENAYILDNGTIVEPKDQGNVLVYLLGK